MSLFFYFFNILNKQDITYAITGRTENYPERIHSDIDIIIPADQFNDFWNFMQSLGKNGINWIQIISHEITAHYCIVTLSNDETHQLIKPDVCSDYYRNGTLFLKASFLLQNRILNSKGFYQLAPDKEFIYYLLKKIDKGYINKEQYKHLQRQWNVDQNGCQFVIKPFFSIYNQTVIGEIFSTNNQDLLIQNLKSFKEDIRLNLEFNLRDYISKLQNRINRIFKPTGLVVAFLGADGCGKSTIINGVKFDLTEVFRRYEQFHLYPKKVNISTSTTNPHGKKPRGFAGSILKLLYFLVLYKFGYWIKIYPLKVKSTFVIFDRYFHDLLVDPIRYRYGTSRFWIKLIAFFIPKPDLWILLDAPTDVIQSRKSEVSPKETERQILEYRKLFHNLKNSFIIDANKSPEEVIYDTDNVIIEYLKQRLEKRYKRF